MKQTPHFKSRAQERDIRHTAIMMIVGHGTCIKRTGVEFWVILNKDLRWAETVDERKELEKASNVFLISNNGVLLTCYGNRKKQKVLSEIKKKSKYKRKKRIWQVQEGYCSENGIEARVAAVA